jgi:hypothetical protein
MQGQQTQTGYIMPGALGVARSSDTPVRVLGPGAEIRARISGAVEASPNAFSITFTDRFPAADIYRRGP